MHRKQQLITPMHVVCIGVSIGIHALLFKANGCAPFSHAQVEASHGYSAVELTLIPTVAAVAANPDPEPLPPLKEELPPAPVVEKPAEIAAPKPVEKTPEPEPQTEDAVQKELLSEKSAVSAEDNHADLLEKGVETGAELTQGIKPFYPLASRRRGEEGSVLIEVTIQPMEVPVKQASFFKSLFKKSVESPAGRPVDVRILTSSGYPLLDQAAVDAAWKCRFKPAMKNGEPVTSLLEQPFIFKLENEK